MVNLKSLLQKNSKASKVYADNPVAYALRQSNMLYESGKTIVMIPSESLNSMGFGNLAMTVVYLENTKKAAKGKTQDRVSSSLETGE